MKILLAEDEQVSRLALEATVQQWGSSRCPPKTAIAPWSS